MVINYMFSVYQTIPKNFSMGTVVDDAKDFYSDRLTKKQRRNTIAEQIMTDHEMIKYGYYLAGLTLFLPTLCVLANEVKL